MIKDLDKIVWEDSVVLGWSETGDSLTVFFELHMAGEHPQVEPQMPNTKDWSGWYKTARLVVLGLISVTGLPKGPHDLTWNEQREEYNAVATNPSLHLDPGGQAMKLVASPMKGWSDLVIEAKGSSIALIFEEFEKQTIKV